MHALDVDLADLARRQHGVVALRQAKELGFTEAMMRSRRGRGFWQPFGPGVILINGAPVTWSAKVLSACLASDGVASHRTAAVLHDVRGFRSGIVEITVPRPVSHPVPGTRFHRSKDLHRCTPVLIDCIPTTPLPRLAADLGGVVPFWVYQEAIEDLIGRKLLTWDDAMRELMTYSRQGRTGMGALRALLSENYGSHIPESVLERAFLTLMKERGLPDPVPQFEVHDRAGFVARVDFAYPAKRLLIELDSVRYHSDRHTFELDRDKRARLVAEGWTVLAFTWRMIIESPGRVASTVSRVLEHP